MPTWTPNDMQSWSMTEASIKEDQEVGAKFLVFLNFWLGTAEKMMAEPEGEISTPDGPIVIGSTITPANAVRAAMELAESRLGLVDVHFMGQLLTVMCMYWIHGDEVARGFSPIELKITGQALAMKLAEMERQAEENAESGPIDEGGADGDQHASEDAAASAIDPLPESEGLPDPGPGAGQAGRAGRLRGADPDSFGESLKRSQARGRERRERSAAAARDDDSEWDDDLRPGGDGASS